MPDKTETSDNARNESVDDITLDAASYDVVDEQDIRASSEDQTAQGANTSGAGQDAGSADAQNDPLGFGEQRMGEEEEPLSELDQLRSQLVDAEGRAAENWDRLVRLQAEMENQRKRAQNDVTKARKFALEGIVSDLLPIKDSLEMGLAAAQADDADAGSIVQGAELTLKMLAQVFEKNNILEVNPVDEKFDPEFHQAMSMQEIEGKAANTVASVMQKGYTLNERLVRPALVMVAK
ncbi:nucleotide exchange factor GrpE [Granulosicoccus antarcticus]|uniref:Protein GrpE n=1 Tax=Granulosicoccus antarcticus IMCC3135 TaxID=1192854 RepID=A0A2Z2NYT3_9GAMM|nr:nucleotide exchange factor GrpE [Granulosicoccus antarcticus]ASJ75091.1 Protein GrpE [Granulosicoccus antarcticus IMCC3135]